MQCEPDFKKPRKTVKIPKTNDTSRIKTNNTYSALSDNEDIVSDASASGKNNKSKSKQTQSTKINQEQTAPKTTPKIRAPPIFVQIIGIKPTTR